MPVLSSLVKQGHSLEIVATKAALQFIGNSTLEGLTGRKVHTELYENGSNMDHIHLVRWAHLIVTAPATANTLNKMASGVADDLVSTLFLAHDFSKPWLVFPAMNTKMYDHPTTQKSLTQLKNWNIFVADSPQGHLACGEYGQGRLAEAEQILALIQNNLNSNDQSNNQSNNPVQTNEKYNQAQNLDALYQVRKSKKNTVLITAGGTQEPLDDVRVISNKSTGKTAAILADEFILEGYEVTYLKAKTAALPKMPCKIIEFETFSDLQEHLLKLLPLKYNYFLHLAAVSDYSVSSINGQSSSNYLKSNTETVLNKFEDTKLENTKIDSSNEELHLVLKKNPKLIQLCKQLSEGTKLIGFKLTSTSDTNIIQNKVQQLFSSAHCDLVIHNDWNQIKTGKHVFNVYKKDQHFKAHLTLAQISLADLSNFFITEFYKEIL